MFKLMQLNGNLFAIVKDEEDISKMKLSKALTAFILGGIINFLLYCVLV